MKVESSTRETICAICDDAIHVDDPIVVLIDEPVHAECAEDEKVEVEWP